MRAGPRWQLEQGWVTPGLCNFTCLSEETLYIQYQGGWETGGDLRGVKVMVDEEGAAPQDFGAAAEAPSPSEEPQGPPSEPQPAAEGGRAGRQAHRAALLESPLLLITSQVCRGGLDLT